MITRENGIHNQFRHGDVLVERIGDAPAMVPSKDPAPTLAEGETSGHSHRVYGGAVMFRDDGFASRLGAQAYIGTVDVPAPSELKHVNRDGSLTNEHDTIPLPPARYVAIAQREYDPDGERRAQD